jgi:hypothetical protein
MTEREPSPPWVAYPDADPWWGGWRQGSSEAWLTETWLPFWKRLSEVEIRAYLERWPPPTDEWRRYVTVLWAG